MTVQFAPRGRRRDSLVLPLVRARKGKLTMTKGSLLWPLKPKMYNRKFTSCSLNNSLESLDSLLGNTPCHTNVGRSELGPDQSDGFGLRWHVGFIQHEVQPCNAEGTGRLANTLLTNNDVGVYEASEKKDQFVRRDPRCQATRCDISAVADWTTHVYLVVAARHTAAVCDSERLHIRTERRIRRC